MSYDDEVGMSYNDEVAMTARSLGYKDAREMHEWENARALGYASPADLLAATRGKPGQRTESYLQQHLEGLEAHTDCVASGARCGATGCRVPR